MGVYNQRLGSLISFDEEKEADIIQSVKELTAKHKLGLLISNLLRIYFENPSKFVNDLKELEKYGISYSRQAFFNSIAKEIDDMRKKVNEIYDMNLKLLTLAKFGKQLGLEGKATNSLMAEFVLEKQIKELSNKLGVEIGAFNSNKLQEVDKLADDTLEFIIETYDSIVTELRDIIFREVQLKVNLADGVVINKEHKVEVTHDDKNEQDNKDNIDDAIKEDNKEENFSAFEEDDEFIDFGNADLGALSNFLGA